MRTTLEPLLIASIIVFVVSVIGIRVMHHIRVNSKNYRTRNTLLVYIKLAFASLGISVFTLVFSLIGLHQVYSIDQAITVVSAQLEVESDEVYIQDKYCVEQYYRTSCLEWQYEIYIIVGGRQVNGNPILVKSDGIDVTIKLSRTELNDMIEKISLER